MRCAGIAVNYDFRDFRREAKLPLIQNSDTVFAAAPTIVVLEQAQQQLSLFGDSMVTQLNRETAKGSRDAAVLLLGFATGLRRSDLAAFELADMQFVSEGLIVPVGRQKREKNDQRGVGRKIAVFHGSHQVTCPIGALQRWLDFRGRVAGPLFMRVSRSGRMLDRIRAQSIADIVKAAAEGIGLDPKRYGGHSLRAGKVTGCSAAGVADSAIMQRSGHKSVQRMSHYIALRTCSARILLRPRVVCLSSLTAT